MEAAHCLRIMGALSNERAWAIGLCNHFRPGINRPLVFHFESSHVAVWERFAAYVRRKIGVDLNAKEGTYFSTPQGHFIAYFTAHEIRVFRDISARARFAVG